MQNFKNHSFFLFSKKITTLIFLSGLGRWLIEQTCLLTKPNNLSVVTKDSYGKEKTKHHGLPSDLYTSPEHAFARVHAHTYKLISYKNNFNPIFSF